MHPERKWLNLLAEARKASAVKAANGVIEISGAIVSSEFEAEWGGGIAATQVTNALDGMSGPLTMRINSPGGDVMAGRAIAQRMREYKGEITVIIDGYAASIASIIAIAGDKVKMAPGALMMIHRAWTLGIGHAEDLLATAAILEKIDSQLAATYAARGNGDEDHYAALMAAETWFTPDEALAEGLVDEVLPEMADKAPAAKAEDTEHDRRKRIANFNERIFRS